MIIALLLVAVAFASLGFMVWVAKGRSAAISRVEELPRRLRRVDIDAFRVLVDPAETQYLWSRLPRSEFRRIQRKRLWAAIVYISCAAENAAVLLRIGEAASRSADLAVAEAGRKLVNRAIRLRIYAFQIKLRIYWQMILPGSFVSGVGLVENYEQMTGLVFYLGRLQRPAANAA